MIPECLLKQIGYLNIDAVIIENIFISSKGSLDFRGWKVPDILLSGDPKKVDEWRHEEALRRTEERRPDLLD
jgi:tRNA (guanine-N1)-methyltransferase